MNTTVTPSETYTTLRGGLVAAQTLVEHLADVDLHDLAVTPDTGEITLVVGSEDAEDAVVDRLALSLAASGDSNVTLWRGQWDGAEVSLRRYDHDPATGAPVAELVVRALIGVAFAVLAFAFFTPDLPGNWSAQVGLFLLPLYAAGSFLATPVHAAVTAAWSRLRGRS